MKIKDLLIQDAIVYCSLQSEVTEVLGIAKKHQYRVSNNTYQSESLFWKMPNKEVCIRLKTMTYGSSDTYRKNGHTIISAIDFILSNSVKEETDLEKAKRLYVDGVKVVAGTARIVYTLSGEIRQNTYKQISKQDIGDGEYVLIFDGENWVEIVEPEQEVLISNIKPTIMGMPKSDPDWKTQKQEVSSVEVGKCYTVDYLGCKSVFTPSKIIEKKNYQSIFIDITKCSIVLDGTFWDSSCGELTFTETPERLPWLNYCIENNKYISEEEFNKLSKVETYNMCKPQSVQLDCRNSTCEFNVGGGNCSNESPAITINNDATIVCWSALEKIPTETVETVEYMNGEQVECLINAEWLMCEYIGKRGIFHVVYNDLFTGNFLQNMGELHIRKPQPVKQPEIGSFCLFSDVEINSVHEIPNNFFDIDKYTGFEDGEFISDDNTSWKYCKQIESIKFKH